MTTKQDDFDGLFKRLCKYLEEQGLVKETSVKFSKLTTDHSRVTFFRNLLSDLKEDFYLYIKRCAQKSVTESQKFRNLGNESYRNRDLKKALSYYNLCVKHAPHALKDAKSSVEDLAFGYANRSAVMFQLQEYYLCVKDIENSIKHGYPKSLLYKLWERKAKCLKQLKLQNTCVKYCYEMSLLTLASAKLDDEKKQQIINSLKSESSSVVENNKEICDHKTCLHFDVPRFCPRVDDINPEITSAASTVSICFTGEKGRHVQATKDIKVGDIVAVESPYASVLLPQFFNSHCHFCVQRCLSPIPCFHCTQAQFCSEKCRQNAWTQFHEIECSVLDTLATAFEGSIPLLAFRIVIILGQREAEKLWKEAYCTLPVTDEVNNQTNDFSDAGVYDSSDYSTIYGLMGHTEDRSVADLFSRTAKATYLLQILKKTSYFDKKNIDNDFKSYVGSLMLRHLQNLPCNAHSIDEIEVSYNAIGQSEPIEIAGGVYSLLSLINHCCDPNVVRHNHGDITVLRAIHPICKGEELLDNYGYHFAVHSKLERQKSMREQYYFCCSCYPCTHNWPLYDKIPTRVQCVPRCACNNVPSLKSSCMHCAFTDSLENYDASVEKFLKGEAIASEVLKISLSHIECLDKYTSVRPWKAYNDCQEVIKQCYAMQGNCYNKL